MSHPTTRPRVVATIGAFDGVHRGHAVLVGQVVDRARVLGCSSLAVTFDPHPDVVLYPERQLTMLTDREGKEERLRELGVDYVQVLEFTRAFSMLRPDEFIGLLEADYDLAELWVGPDFALGRGRSGTIAALSELGSGQGFALHVVLPVRAEHEVVSSTYIRSLLAQGDVDRANELLGYPYTVAAVVEHGDARGAQLGFPTANLSIPVTRALPADGVYLAEARVDGRWWPAVVNLGGRPTFSDTRRLLEAHLLDFGGDLYGRRLPVRFLDRLRDVRRFDSIDELVAQIRRDADAARERYAELGGGQHQDRGSSGHA
ncbi:MAG: bifunctional riboflavin kinase/FAD synthetase [Chloroflexi bacterium]|nr:bifunctional riboflavin kinase/FAD synthetase [Chloroflexota bacterium]